MRQPVSILKSLFLIIAVTAVSLAAAELFVRFALFSSAEREKGAEALWRKHQNFYNKENGDGTSNCSISDTITPNPYLQFNLFENGDCGRFFVNNLSMPDVRDYPAERSPDFYSLVLVGGSVASHVADARWLKRNDSWLETALNKKYISPNGKPFRVFSGATGGWNFPNQLTFLSLYGDAVNAVVALDGYNEAERAAANLPIYSPDPISYTAAIRSLRYPVSTMNILFTGSLRHLALNRQLTRDSFLLYALFLSSVEYFMRHEVNLSREFENGFSRNFVFPRGWSAERALQKNKMKYLSYIRMLAATAEALELNYAHFVQPNRLIGKTLTEAEKKFQQVCGADCYRTTIIAPSLDLATRGYHTASLHGVFQKEKETIYADSIHCKFDDKGYSRGYELMAQAMADKIAEFWHLKAKRTTSSR